MSSTGNFLSLFQQRGLYQHEEDTFAQKIRKLIVEKGDMVTISRLGGAYVSSAASTRGVASCPTDSNSKTDSTTSGSDSSWPASSGSSVVDPAEQAPYQPESATKLPSSLRSLRLLATPAVASKACQSKSLSFVDENRDATSEAENAASQHEMCFVGVAALQLALELIYNVLFIARMDVGVKEVQLIYKTDWSSRFFENMYQIVFAAQVLNTLIYYLLLVIAVHSRHSHNYTVFARWSVCSIIWMISLAYMNKFNLLIFVLHSAMYLYARYLSGVVDTLGVLPAAHKA